MSNFNISFKNPFVFDKNEYPKYKNEKEPIYTIHCVHETAQKERKNVNATSEDNKKLLEQDFANQNEFSVYTNQIKEKTAFLSSKTFKNLSGEAKCQWFFQNLDDLNTYQEQHFQFLVNYLTNFIKIRFQIFFFVTNLVIFAGSGLHYGEEEIFSSLNRVLEELDKNLTKLESVLNMYNQSIKEHEPLLKQLVSIFKKNYRTTLNKEKKKNKNY